jgi:hypothetical protein
LQAILKKNEIITTKQSCICSIVKQQKFICFTNNEKWLSNNIFAADSFSTKITNYLNKNHK